MFRVPQALGLIFCRRLSVDADFGETSLAGLFQALHFEQFPTPVQRFTVFCALYGGEGEGIIELAAARVAMEKDIYRHQRWTTFGDRYRAVQLEFNVHKIIFPTPGRYWFTLRFNGAVVTQRQLDIFAV